MHSYRERLYAPVSFWVTGLVTMFTFGSIVWFGFPLWVAPVTYGVLFAVTAAFLLNWGRATIEVSGTELVADGHRLPLTAAGEVRPLDEAQTTALRGPRADPRAYLLIRPYLRQAVYVEVTGAAGHAGDQVAAGPQAAGRRGRGGRRADRRRLAAIQYQGAPYWLLATRRPAELAAAIESSRPAARAGNATVG